MSAELLDQVADIVTTMSKFDFRLKVKVHEFFRMNESNLKMLLKFSHEMKVTYIQEVIFTS